MTLSQLFGDTFALKDGDKFIDRIYSVDPTYRDPVTVRPEGPVVKCIRSAVPTIAVVSVLIDYKHLAIMTGKFGAPEAATLHLFYDDGGVWVEDNDCHHDAHIASVVTLWNLERLL